MRSLNRRHSLRGGSLIGLLFLLAAITLCYCSVLSSTYDRSCAAACHTMTDIARERSCVCEGAQ
jgi:hypothetical protein